MKKPMSPAGLAHYDAARSALAAAFRVDDVKSIRDKAVALAAYARQAKDTALIGHATEIRLRAERRWGELYRPEAKAKGGDKGGKKKIDGSRAQPSNADTPTLNDMGVSKTQSAKWQALAALGEDKFEEKVGRAKTKAENITTSAPRYARVKFTGETEWYTPPDIIEAAREVLGGIDLDPASSVKAQEVVRAKNFFTKDDDGLAQDWSGRVWLNPPYAQPLIANFAAKTVSEWRAGRVSAAIVLINNSSDTAWFHELAGVASAMCFTRGRIRFLDPDGAEAVPTQGQTFFYFGGDAARFSARFGALGFIAVRFADG
jgi:phage N-6-adenine-methyltransferase